MLGISESTLSNKLTGKIRFNDAEIFSLSHWLGVPSDALLASSLGGGVMANIRRMYLRARCRMVTRWSF